MPADCLRDILAPGDMRTTGRADEAAALLATDPALLAGAVKLLADSNPGVRMRAADAIEKASRTRPGLLRPHKAALLGVLDSAQQQEVQWHLLQMLSSLDLAADERAIVFRRAASLLHSPSRIVAAEALSGMFALSEDTTELRHKALEAAHLSLEAAAPSLRVRARKLLGEASR